MQERIEQIVDGRLYSTELADVIAGDDYWDGNNYERHGRNTHLYKTFKGNFFLVFSTQWEGERCYIEPLSENEAKQQYEDLPEQYVSYLHAFGVEPEEA